MLIVPTGDNQLTSLPAEIANFSRLEYLRLGEYNRCAYPMTARFVFLSENNSNITCASQCFIIAFSGNNELTSLPTEIGKLSSLQELYFCELCVSNLIVTGTLLAAFEVTRH